MSENNTGSPAPTDAEGVAEIVADALEARGMTVTEVMEDVRSGGAFIDIEKPGGGVWTLLVAESPYE